MVDSWTLFLVPFSVSLVVLGVCERLVHAVLTLFAWSARSKHDPARHVVGGAVHVGASIASGLASVVVRCVYLASQVVVWFFVIFCLLAAVYVVYEEYPSVVMRLFDFYNARLGPFVHGYLLLPLELLNLVFKGLVPLYNGGLWLVRTLWIQGLLPMLWDQLVLLMEASTVLVSLARHCMESASDFLDGVSCDAGDTCLTRPATLDIVTPMGDVRALAVLTSRFAGSVCSVLEQPVDFLLYPLVDINLAQAAHGFANAVVHFFVHLPIVSWHRCARYGATETAFDFLMCTPDLTPVFSHLVSAVRDAGNLVDNWIGVAFVMVERVSTGIVATECAGARPLSPDVFRSGGLMAGRVAAVGLTNWLMAATNGSVAYFFGQVNSDAAVRAWAEGVDVSLGVAAVSYNDVNDMDVSTLTMGRRPGSRQATTLMGCRCEDTDHGINVRCAFLPYSGSLSAGTGAMDVWFQDRTWAQGLTCASVEITVRSVRWPVRRVEGKSVPFGAGSADLPTTDCLTRGTCESVDATIWVVPKCDLLPAEQCTDVAIGTSCFPFCMAARAAGSRNANPVLVNAETWRTGRQLLSRDCVSGAADPSTVSSMSQIAATAGTATTLSFGQTTLGGATSDPLFTVDYSTGPSVLCSVGVNTASWVHKNASSAVLPFVRRRGQPFAIAGDTLLIDDPAADGGTRVMVERLGGNQQDVFTLERTWNDLPAAPKRLVPIDELGMDVSNMLVVPYDYTATRIHATNTRNYVFYAVSPNLQIFQGYLDYCLHGNDRLPQFQLMALSSYGPLRVYRVRAYCQEECTSDGLSAQVTLDGFVKDGAFNSDTFGQGCNRTFNATIDGLEYVNEQNVAVTVQVADRSFDVATMSGAGSTYQTYWLNPQTMGLRADRMWPTMDTGTLSVEICIPGLAVPHLGTLGAELGVTSLLAARFVVGGVWYAPGLISLWKGAAACPLESRGHSILGACGDDVYSLEDFFDSADQATAVFWSIPTYIADVLDSRNLLTFSPVSDLLRGYSMYGRETTSILMAKGNVMNLLITPLPNQMSELWAAVRQPNVAIGSAKIAMGASSMARFTAKAFGQIILASARASLSGGFVDFSVLWRQFLSALYDLRPYFRSSVSDRASAACLGVEQMFGGYNPWGRLVFHQCRSTSVLMEGLLDLFLSIFVDIPIVKCVCRDSAGYALTDFARQQCIPNAPASVRGVLLGMVAAAEGTGSPSLLCPAVTKYVRFVLANSIEPWFGELYSALDALGDSVDYALVGIDSDAGQCNNFHSDPQVVIIMPEPIDYFQACGKIQSCRTKCAGNWQAFQDALVAAGGESTQTGLVSLTREVDSMFFPVPSLDIVAPGKVVAITQAAGIGPSACRAAEDQVLAVASLTQAALAVAYYCVPSSPSASVYATESATLNWENAKGLVATQVSFLDPDGGSVAALVLEENSPVLYRFRRGGEAQALLSVPNIPSLLLADQYPMHITGFIALGARILASVAVRTNDNSKFGRGASVVWLDPDSTQLVNGAVFAYKVDVPDGLWKGYAVSEYDQEEKTDASTVYTMLFWPIEASLVAQRVRFRVTNTTAGVVQTTPYVQDQSLAARASLLPTSLVLSKNLRESTGQLNIFSSSGGVYDWLQLLRLRASGLNLHSASLSNAQSVTSTISIRTACDGTDCRGCQDLALRALCSAYQSCSVVRCIGTPVNLKRPLCGVGMALRSTGLLGVESVHGSWLMIVDILMILVELTTQRNLPGVEITWPDEVFLGNMCVAKDLSAEFFGILMSTINSALQLAQVPVPALQQVSNLDSNANTVLSLSTAAMTSFLHQLGLAPVYVLAVSQKIMMCQARGVLAVMSNSGFAVSLEPANLVSSTDAISGRCITQSATIESQQTGDAASQRSIGAIAGQLLTGSAQVQLLRKIEPMMHMAEGVLTYFIGVIGSFANVLQTWDVAHCMIPDVTIASAARCACGDTVLAILPARRAEGADAFAYWCTGTVSVIDSNNKARVVWNPYTYQELQGKLAGRMDEYLLCASRSNFCTVPNDNVFSSQGVSMMAVLTRCRQNYVNRQWDPAAYALYDQQMLDLHVPGGVRPRARAPSDGVGGCLLEKSSKGASNQACLDALSLVRGWTETYWSYVQLIHAEVGAHEVDACLVFSGPAANELVPDERRTPFQRCLAGYADGSTGASCDLSGFVWSPASSNTVPVATRHVIAPGYNNTLESVAQRMAAAKELVMAQLIALRGFTNAELNVAFFSAEGDLVHQLLDCVFMGPFARMDYWPAPACDESVASDCLVGPYWARDEGGGRTRKLDISTCPASSSLPFTCGSPTRRAMVKYFVQHLLQSGQSGAEFLAVQIRDWLASQELLWGDERTFGCDCPAGAAEPNSVSCCLANATGHYLPSSLSNLSLDLPTVGVLSAMEQRLHQFYQEAKNEADPWIFFLGGAEKAKYDWPASAGAHRVVDEAAYDPTSATGGYTSAEARSPPRVSSDATLWRVCHGALRQVMFTMPVNGDGTLRDAVPLFPGGGPEAISAHVDALLSAARGSSPLFRHYQPRHHPSPSAMCEGPAAEPAAGGAATFADFFVSGVRIQDGAELGSVPVLGYLAGRLGAYATTCFCGWALAGEWCVAPGAACASLNLPPNCSYRLSGQDAPALAAAFVPGAWDCPHLELSEHLGFLDPAATEAWLRGGLSLNTSSEFLLRYGPGGLKAGNVLGSDAPALGLDANTTASLRQVLRSFLRPADRAVDPALAPVRGCSEHARAPSDLADEFVETLFPMAQGVRESGVGAYCLRYAIELARLKALELMTNADDTFTHSAAAQQRGVVLLWRRRCGSQVQVIGLCNALDMYHQSDMQAASCLQPWTLRRDPSVEMYVTPECLVNIGGYFYDPCQCQPYFCEPGAQNYTLTRAAIERDGCRLRFDPRQVVRAAELGWWGADETDPAAAASNAWLASPWNLLDRDELMAQMLRGGGAGNTPPETHWGFGEGFMNETAEYCDLIADYWPEAGHFPVGYHVTPPCDAADAGYRSFDNVFAREDTADGAVLVYYEDQTRDGDLVDSHFGAGGACRQTNFGFDMYETNTMRVCTRLSSGENVDVHVPHGGNPSGPLEAVRCSATSKDLPWADGGYYAYYDPAFHAVGTIPNLPTPTDSKYPARYDRYMRVGPQHLMRAEGWGEQCQDFDLPNCSAGWACPTDFYCADGGVCMHLEVDCNQHSDCRGGYMCSALGSCVRPRITVVNELGVAASFRGHTSSCPGEEFSMLGGSYWGYVPDFLEAHGMCSYRHWREYLHTLSQCNCTNSTPTSCTLDATRCPYFSFGRIQNNNWWWDSNSTIPNRLKMIPTTCDRDYERFMLDGEEMRSCVPGPGQVRLMLTDNSQQSYAARDSMWKPYDEVTRTVSLRYMPFRAQTSFGFLGFSTDPSIASCNKFQQCYADDFTKNGAVQMIPGAVKKPNRSLIGGALYNPDDIFRCGVIGYFDVAIGMCRIDQKLFPLYRLLCFPPSAAREQCLPALSITSNALIAACSNVLETYDQKYSVIHDVNVPALANLFQIFRQPQTLAEHLNTVTCAKSLYAAVSASPFESKGFYFPLTFTLLEFPFPWFYQCIVGARLSPLQSLDHVLYPCPFYESATARQMGTRYTPVEPYNQFGNYIFAVRGGYERDAVTAAVATQLTQAKAMWNQCVEEKKQLFYGATDTSYPVCYQQRRWNLPAATKIEMRLIETFIRPNCGSSLQSSLCTQYALNNSNVTILNLIDHITHYGGGVVQQSDVVDPLLTRKIRDFGLDHLQGKSDIDSLVIRSVGTARAYPLSFDPSLPAADSVEFAASLALWRASYLPSTQDRMSKVLDVCPETPLQVYKDSAGVTHGDWDTDQLSGSSTWVTACPLYQTGDGGCHYIPIAITPTRSFSVHGNDTAVSASFDSYTSALYQAVKDCYDQRLAPVESTDFTSIPTSALAFFTEDPWPSFQFDLTSASKYMNNIEPDVNTPIMCKAGNQVIDYSNCTDSNFQALQQHVASDYTKRAGVIIPDQYQMDWEVDRGMLGAGAIFSYASTSRNPSRQFLASLLDPSVCQANNMPHSQRLCAYTASGRVMSAASVSPWLSGDWNPYDQCDVDQTGPDNGYTETINVQCYFDQFCPPNKGFDTDYYNSMPYKQACLNKQGEKTVKINVDASSSYNLCRLKLLEDSVCAHDQGMLGGTDGMPMEEYAINGNLYTLHNFTDFPAGDGDPFGNVLLRGAGANYGFVRMPGAHIGGHHLAMLIANSTMRVFRMPLKTVPDNARMRQWDTEDVQAWLPGWVGAMASDDNAYLRAVRDAEGQLAWDCPLRRRAFYGGGVPEFPPSLPSARRSQRTFGDMSGGRFAHPMQERGDASAAFGYYETANGFCFCPVSTGVAPGLCSVLTSNLQHNCSLYKTVRAMRGKEWGWSHTFTPMSPQNEPSPCTMQLDWPFAPGTLRDGGTIDTSTPGSAAYRAWQNASDTGAQRCHVLDRTQPFAYVFKSANELLRAGFTTLDRGACHTGRVQTAARGQDSRRCVRVEKGDSAARLLCTDNSATTVPRGASKTVAESLSSARFQRRRCSQCSPPPVFKTKQGAPLPPESSFGVPYRRSVERALASDLRQALCQGGSACLSQLNRTAWLPGNFLRAYLETPASLFASGGTFASGLYNASFAAAPPVNDDALWARPWAYCPSAEALRTGANCTGSIPKAQWRADRVHTCHSTITAALKNGADPMAKTNICSLDGRLDTLCQAMRTAQGLIASANCLASGSDKCALQEFVYTPATWETTNQAFVHQTVEEFYKRTDGCASAADCICPTDAALAAFRANNSYALAQCPAVSVMVMQEVLKGVRSLVQPICEAASRLLSMVINLMLTLSPSSDMSESSMGQALLDWAEFKRLLSGTGSIVSDLFFDLMFNSGRLGTWLRKTLLDTCGYVNTFHRYFARFWCGLVVEQLPVFLGSLRAVGTWIDIGFSVVNDVFQVILRNYLPNAMMDLYQAGYKNYYQSSRYKEKQAAYASQIALDLSNANQGKPLTIEQKAMAAANRDKKIIASMGAAVEAEQQAAKDAKTAGGFLTWGPVGIAAGVLEAGITGYQMYSSAQTVARLQKVMNDFPDSLTLFDFTSFQEGIDTLVQYMDADLTCYSMDPNADLFRCSALDAPSPDSATIQDLTMPPSACWADAQQRQVGVSTLYACTPTSFCCEDGVVCGKPRLCGDCPVPASTALRTYGCDTLTQRCQCGLPAFDVSRCVAQRDCGPSTSCSLLTSMNDVSFGAIKTCSACSVPSICLIGGDSASGQCTCLPTGDAEVDRCASGAGSLTFPNPIHLCGYSPDVGAYFYWPELALVQCANLYATVCAEVVTEQGTTLYMPVGSRLRGMQFAYSSRRLLSLDAGGANASAVNFGLPSAFSPEDPADDITPDVLHDMVTNHPWNHTAAPCATLAHAYQQGRALGPVDESALHSCVYWRSVGRQVIAEFDLQSLLGLDTFLLSPDDLAAALGQRGVAEELILRKPYALVVAAFYSAWMKPVRAVLIASHGPNVSRLLQGWRGAWPRNLTFSNLSARRGRRLLSLADEVEAEVQRMPYYAEIKRVADRIPLPTLNASIAVAVAQSWLRDGFAWRKTAFTGSCPPVQAAWSSATQVVRVLRQYYVHFVQIHAPRNISRSLRAVLPDLRAPANATRPASTGRAASAPIGSTRAIGAAVLEGALWALGMTRGDVAWFLSDPCGGRDCTESNRWTLTYLVESVTFCDFEAVTYCSARRRDMVSCALFALLVYAAVAALAGFLGVPAVGTVAFYLIPFFVLWYSTGVSPACLPMLPTCLLDDLLAAVGGILPVSAALPPLLLAANGTTLRSCEELQFGSWRDPIAFLLCDLGLCNASGAVPGLYWDPALRRAQLESKDAAAYRVCAAVSAVNSLPAALVLMLGVVLLSSLVMFVLSAIPPLLTMVWHVVSFNHAPLLAESPQ